METEKGSELVNYSNAPEKKKAIIDTFLKSF